VFCQVVFCQVETQSTQRKICLSDTLYTTIPYGLDDGDVNGKTGDIA
jgi:hypothetical protein